MLFYFTMGRFFGVFFFLSVMMEFELQEKNDFFLP